MTKLSRFLGIKLKVLFSHFIALSDNCFVHSYKSIKNKITGIL
jgi:hypothetical protein